MSKFNDLIKAQDLKVRRKEILDLSAKPNKSKDEAYYLNTIVLKETELILSKKGKSFNVVSEINQSNKLGDCYFNAVQMMNKGFGYVEGYASDKVTHIKYAHAWNVDKEGNHIDFTLSNAEEHDYFGIVLTEGTVYEVGIRNGHIWFAALPFLKGF